MSTSPDSEVPWLRDEPVSLPLLSAERKYSGRVWNVDQEVFEYAGSLVTRDFVRHTGAVAIAALDAQNRLLVIQQYRHPIRAREWEIPAGLLDIAGENPLDCAQRELAEEADLVAREWNVLADYAPSPGGSDEVVRIYLARHLSPTLVAHPRTDEESDMRVEWVGLEDAVSSVLAGHVGNSIFSIAVLTMHAMRESNWISLRHGDAPWPRYERRTQS